MTRLTHVAVLGLFSILTVVTTWPLARMAWWSSVDYGDTLTTAYGMAWQAHALVTDPLHLFDANVMYPFRGTLAFDELNTAPALLGAPLFWLSGNAGLEYNLILLLSFVLCGYGAWLLVRNLTGSTPAGLVTGVAYAFSLYRFGHLEHLTILNGQWLPLVLWALHRLWRRPTWGAAGAFAAFFALQALSSHYLAFYTLLATGLFVVFYAGVERRLPWAFLGWLAAGGGLATLVVLPVAAGYLLGQEGGFHRTLADINRYTATLQSYLAAYAGNPLYKDGLLARFADPGTWPWERSLFPGLVAPALAVVALAGRRQRANGSGPPAAGHDGPRPASPDTLFYGLLAGTAFVLSFGPEMIPTFESGPVGPMPYLILYLLVPGWQTMRVVTRIMVLLSLGLSVLAGFGVRRLLAGRLGQGRWARRALPVVLGGLLLLESWSAPLALLPLAAGGDIPPVYRWLAAQPPGTPVVEYPMLLLQRGPRNVALVSLYEYYATYHWQPTPNAALTVRPNAWTALTAEMETCFPCPRSLDILWALGVSLAVVHQEHLSGPQQQDFAWRSTAGRDAGLYPDEFVRVAAFGADEVYRIARHGLHPLTELRGYLRPGATLALGAPAADPGTTGAYLAALGYWLRDWPEFGDPAWGFGQPLAPRPAGGTDYALLYAGEDPAPYGFAAGDALWRNEQVVLYGRR